MDNNTIQNDLSIIKNMIEKTRQQTAESGSLFITIGFVWLLIPVILVFLQNNDLKNYWWPIFIGGLIVTLIIATIIGAKENKRALPVTYSKKIFSQLWLVVGGVFILTGFVFPMLNVYPVQYISVITWPVIAIGIYLSGVIYEISIIRWLSISWIIGAFLMALITIPIHLYIALLTMFFGFILPGVIFSRQYKKRSN